jgi:integrase
MTYKQYKNSFNHLSRFVLIKKELKDYPLKQLDLDFIEDYELYLRVDADLSVGSVLNHIKFLKKIVNRAMSQKTILYDPFPEYEVKKPKSKYLHVSREALERIMSAKIESESVRFVRDIFVFSCFTGLAYADICQICEQHLHQMPDGSIWIEIPRYKTDVESRIRLLEIPIIIIEKYRSERKGERLFNMPSNGIISTNMRKIEEICEIDHLHFHMARHTFATLICLTNGVSMKTLSKLMGHTTMRITKSYGEITPQKVGSEMKNLAKRSKREKRGKVRKMKIEN